MNNYEKIKNMSVDEMADWVCDLHNCEYCPYLNNRGTSCITIENPWKQWLLEECEE